MGKYFGKQYLIRYILIIISLFFCGLGMTVMRFSCLGTEPFSCVNYSISERFGIPMAGSMIAINGVFLLLSLLFLRSSLGYGTVANMLLLGTAGDIWKNIFLHIIGHEVSFSGMEQLPLRLVLLCLGMFVMVFFNSFYISAGLGMAPYDAFGYIIEKITRRKIAFQWARVASDVTCVVSAFRIASGKGTQWELIGIGTVVMACGIGPLLSWIITNIAEPFYRRIGTI